MDEILLDASDLTLSGQVWSAVCEEIPRCVAFNNRGFLKAFPRNESVDSYISMKSCGVNGPAELTNGSCLQPNSNFVRCHNDSGRIDTWYYVKAQYNLPPHLVADACRRDNRCAGFMVTNNREYGMLLEHVTQSENVTDVWTKVPHQRDNASVLVPSAWAASGGGGGGGREEGVVRTVASRLTRLRGMEET